MGIASGRLGWGGLVLGLSLAAAAAVPAHAAGFLRNVHGQLRMYYFTRGNSGNEPRTTNAFSLGGSLHADSVSWFGISAGATFYDASALGLNDPSASDTTLPSKDVTAIGEAYLQYRNQHVGLLRGGNQLYHSPWANPSDSRMIPAAFQGVAYQSPTVGGLRVDLARMFQWKNRTASTFERTNQYPSTGSDNLGFLAVGATYGRKPVQAAVWYYRFYNIADMVYVDGKVAMPVGMDTRAFVGGQYLNETDSGSARLGYVDSQVYGLVGGVGYHGLTLSIGYDHITSNPGAFAGGDIVSPYTQGYATDPLYTTSMTQGAVEQKAAGDSWKVRAVWWGLGHSVRAIASYARYHVNQFAHPAQTGGPWEVDADVTYFPAGRFKGLSLRDRLGVFTYAGAPRPFVYNRVMVQYAF